MWRRHHIIWLVLLLTAETAVIALPHDHRGEVTRVGAEHRAACHRGPCLAPVLDLDPPKHCIACSVTTTCLELGEENFRNRTLPALRALTENRRPRPTTTELGRPSSRGPPYTL